MIFCLKQWRLSDKFKKKRNEKVSLSLRFFTAHFASNIGNYIMVLEHAISVNHDCQKHNKTGIATWAQSVNLKYDISTSVWFRVCSKQPSGTPYTNTRVAADPRFNRGFDAFGFAGPYDMLPTVKRPSTVRLILRVKMNVSMLDLVWHATD